MIRWVSASANWVRRRASIARQWAIDVFVPRYRVVDVEANLPSRLKRHKLYVVQEDGFEEQAATLCPCGRNHVLHLNLLPDERPCWRLTRHAGGHATLNPSVWRQKDCRSHFWLRGGRVIWVRETRN